MYYTLCMYLCVYSNSTIKWILQYDWYRLIIDSICELNVHDKLKTKLMTLTPVTINDRRFYVHVWIKTKNKHRNNNNCVAQFWAIFLRISSLNTCIVWLQFNYTYKDIYLFSLCCFFFLLNCQFFNWLCASACLIDILFNYQMNSDSLFVSVFGLNMM